MACSKNSNKRFYSVKFNIKKRRNKSESLILHLKKLEKEQTKLKVRRKEIKEIVETAEKYKISTKLG